MEFFINQNDSDKIWWKLKTSGEAVLHIQLMLIGIFANHTLLTFASKVEQTRAASDHGYTQLGLLNNFENVNAWDLFVVLLSS